MIKINEKSDIGNRPFYYSDIFVDPQNENRLYSVSTYVNVSEDGGKNFKQLMPVYNVNNGVHPDHHAWWIHPDDGSFMIDGNDGVQISLTMEVLTGDLWEIYLLHNSIILV